MPAVSATTTGAFGGSTTTSCISVADTPITGGTTPIKIKTEADGSLTAFKSGHVWKSFTASSLTGMDAKLAAGDIALQLLSARRGKSTQLV